MEDTFLFFEVEDRYVLNVISFLIFYDIATCFYFVLALSHCWSAYLLAPGVAGVFLLLLSSLQVLFLPLPWHWALSPVAGAAGELSRFLFHLFPPSSGLFSGEGCCVWSKV